MVSVASQSLPQVSRAVSGKKSFIRRIDTRERRSKVAIVIALFVLSFLFLQLLSTSPLPSLQISLGHPSREVTIVQADQPKQKALIFYNRPPKTGSTTIRIAFKETLDKLGMVSAKCFNMIEWNEMAFKTIVNRRDIDFYGCHTRVTSERYTHISAMRGGNVTFITSTRAPGQIILSAYLQRDRHRNIAQITDPTEMDAELQRYQEYVDQYPVNALYKYHGADYPLFNCPTEYQHLDAMRRIAERYEVVIDLERPNESAAIVEAVTGLKVNFGGRYNVRTTDTSSPMLAKLAAVDTSHKMCGNDLVHSVLKTHYNIIKDRLMQNRCFTEETANLELCEKASFTMGDMRERSRVESFKERAALMEKES